MGVTKSQDTTEGLNWMYLEGIMLCEISGTEKNKHYIVLLIYGIYFFFFLRLVTCLFMYSVNQLSTEHTLGLDFAVCSCCYFFKITYSSFTDAISFRKNKI